LKWRILNLYIGLGLQLFILGENGLTSATEELNKEKTTSGDA